MLILLRHGESEWNLENKFTGWYDCDLTDKGVKEAKQAGELLLKATAKTPIDITYTSVLKRAIKTHYLALEKMDQLYLPVVRDLRLNERHYGGLQGLNKKETAEKYGENQVFIWRRSYDIPPPTLDDNDKRHPKFDPRYKGLSVPNTESLKMVVERVLPFYESEIEPLLKKGKTVLIVAHGNSLRALVKYLDNISDDDIAQLNIPTGVPLVYEMTSEAKPIKHYYLGDQDEIAKKEQAVANQGKK
eukprot:NODE_40_length_35084_cov_0.543519.p16 type:complete len:245 gc:universal NODE_40_length_35084_cov_0.543519:15376-14642(-)